MKWDRVTEICAAVAGFFLSLLGGWTVPLKVLAIFVILDYITGVAVAVAGKSKKTKRGGIDSRIVCKGLMKKVGVIIVVMVAVQLEQLVGLNHHGVSQAVIYLFISSEGISILENTSLLGVIKIPVLNNILEQLKPQNPKLGQILIEKGVLTEEQLKTALKEQGEKI